MSGVTFDHVLSVYEVEAIVQAKKNGKLTDVYLIDIRENYERDSKGFIPNSIHIPAKDLMSALSMSGDKFRSKYGVKKPSKNSPLVFYCSRTQRSSMAAESAAEVGYKVVTCMDHGYEGWMEKNTKEAYDEDL